MGNIARVSISLLVLCLSAALFYCITQFISHEESSASPEVREEPERVSETTQVNAQGYSYEIMSDWESDLTNASSAEFYPQGKENADLSCLEITEYMPNRTLVSDEERIAYLTPGFSTESEDSDSPTMFYENIARINDGETIGITATVTISTGSCTQRGMVLRFFVDDNRFVEARYIVSLDQFETNQSAIERILASFKLG